MNEPDVLVQDDSNIYLRIKDRSSYISNEPKTGRVMNLYKKYYSQLLE